MTYDGKEILILNIWFAFSQRYWIILNWQQIRELPDYLSFGLLQDKNDFVLIVAFDRLYAISIISSSIEDFVKAVMLQVDFIILPHVTWHQNSEHWRCAVEENPLLNCIELTVQQRWFVSTSTFDCYGT